MYHEKNPHSRNKLHDTLRLQRQEKKKMIKKRMMAKRPYPMAKNPHLNCWISAQLNLLKNLLLLFQRQMLMV